MIDPAGLLAVARDLANLDSKRPRQASLRRAVSTAYYAVFHLLIRAAADEHFGTGVARPVADRGVRWFEHGKMRGVCEEFAKWADAIEQAKKAPAKPSSDAAKAEQDKWERLEEGRKRTQPKLFRTFETAYATGPSPQLRTVAERFVALHTAREFADYDPTFQLTRATALAYVEAAASAFNKMRESADDPLRRMFLLLLLTTTDIVRER